MKCQNAEELKQEFADFEISQPLVKKNQTALNLENKESFDLKGYDKKLLSTLLTFIGIYLTYASSLIIFQVFIANLAHISEPSIVFLVFTIGLTFTILGVGRFENKSYYLLYLSVPFMSLILGFLFMLAPASWHGWLFGGFSLFLFPVVLFVFYYLKGQIESSENKLNFF